MTQQGPDNNQAWELPDATPRRWLIVTQYYPPEMGATQVRLSTLTRILRELGIEVEVLTAMPNYPTGIVPEKYRGKWSYREVIDGVPVLRTWVYGYGGWNTFKRILNFLSYTFTALFQLGGLRRPDVIFIESLPLPVGIIGLFGKTFLNVPYIYNIPDLQIEDARSAGWLGNSLLLNVAASFENALMHNAWRVSTVSNGFIDFYHRQRKIPRWKLTMLPNGADVRRLRPMAPDPELIERMGVAGKKVFVYAGTHAHYHRMDTIIEAAELVKNRDDIRIVMVGHGPARQYVIDLAKEKGLNNVIFGQSPFDETARLMSIARAAIVLLRDAPTIKLMRLAKTFPPLACGKPVIFSGHCESADLIEQHSCGIVTPTEDPQRLAEAILRLADDESEAMRLGHNGRHFMETKLNWPDIVQRWLKELMKGRYPGK